MAGRCRVGPTVLSSGVVTADQIVGIGLSAHGDSLFPIDADGQPIRPAILSLDSRAHTVVDRWRVDGTLERALPLTGQVPLRIGIACSAGVADGKRSRKRNSDAVGAGL